MIGKGLICFFLFIFAQPKTLIIGDSISAYITGWQDNLCKSKNLNCVNIAKTGSKTGWMLKNLKTHLKNNSGYGSAIIYGGVNDIFTYVKIDTAVNNIQRIVDLCNSKGIKPYLIIGYDPETVMQNTWIKDKIVEAKLRNRYIEYQKRLMCINNAVIIPMVPTTNKDSSDGIHLSSQGHKTFYDWLKKYI